MGGDTVNLGEHDVATGQPDARQRPRVMMRGVSSTARAAAPTSPPQAGSMPSLSKAGRSPAAATRDISAPPAARCPPLAARRVGARHRPRRRSPSRRDAARHDAVWPPRRRADGPVIRGGRRVVDRRPSRPGHNFVRPALPGPRLRMTAQWHRRRRTGRPSPSPRTRPRITASTAQHSRRCSPRRSCGR